MDSRTPSANEPELYCVEIRTTQWETMVAWYRTAIGLRSLFRVVDDGYALLAAGPARLAIVASGDLTPTASRCTLALEVDDLQGASARLRAAGTQAEAPRLTAEGYEELVTADPDGNPIRLFAWAPTW
jgi:hypothetical protein